MRAPKTLRGIGQHLARGWKRYRSQGGDRLAAAVSYYGFLSFFPLLLLAMSVVGFVVKGSVSAEQSMVRALNRFLPGGLVDTINLNTLAQHRSQLGALALVGLVISGTGWIGSLRESLRRMWGKEDISRHFLVSKLLDVGLLAALGAVLTVSVALSGVASQTTDTLLRWLNWQHTSGARTLVAAIGLVLPFLVDTAIFGYLFSLMPQSKTPARALVKGAFFGAGAFEVLKLVGAYYVARITKTGTPIYGTVAVVIGLVIWLNLVSRVTLFIGAWTATATEAAGSNGMADRTVDVGGAT